MPGIKDEQKERTSLDLEPAELSDGDITVTGLAPAGVEPAEDAAEPGFEGSESTSVDAAVPDNVVAEKESGGTAEAGAASIDLESMYVQDLEQQLVEKERKLDEVYAAFRSSQAETSRIRERLERDREKRILQEKVRLFSRILEPLDNLERSLDAAQKAGEDTKLAAGLVMVHRQICDALFSLGLQRTDPTGQKFDPTRHEAVSVAAVTDEAQHDTVVTCVQPGYVIGDQLVRAARVIVGRKS